MTQGNGVVAVDATNGAPPKAADGDIELQNVTVKLDKNKDELQTTKLTMEVGEKKEDDRMSAVSGASDAATIEVSEITARADREKQLPKFITGDDDDSIVLPPSQKPKLSRTNAVNDMLGILRPPSPTGSTVSVMTTTLDVEPNGQLKKANRYLRWNLLFTFIIFFFITLPIWLSLVPSVRLLAFEIVLLLTIFLQITWMIATFNALRMLVRLRREHARGNRVAPVENGEAKKSKSSPNFNFKRNRPVKHLVGICMYKEPLDVLAHTVDSLARQAEATEKISVVIGFEEGTPDKEMKTAQLHEMYDSKFERFMVAIHPRGVPGEIPGKCSNFNYCSRTAIKTLKKDFTYGLSTSKSELIMTTGDCDSVFPLRYFDLLEADYLSLSEKDKHRSVWQSPLFYCMNLDKSPFFVRVVGLLRAFFMMGFLIPMNINTMSIFSMSLKLYEDGKYTHPGYQMDDIIALIRWMLAVRSECRIRCIPVSTISGPTSGANYWNELQEWARQIRRWTIGAAEVFHYFAIKSRRLPFLVAVSWAIKFIFYYGLLLCVAPIFCIIAPPLVEAILNTTEDKAEGLLLTAETFIYIMLGMLGLQYVWFAFVFLINKWAEPTFPDGLKDETPFYRSFFHYIMTFPTVVGYCLVELYAFLEVSIRGKSVCQHVPSKKDGLSNVPSMANMRSASDTDLPNMPRSVSQVNMSALHKQSK